MNMKMGDILLFVTGSTAEVHDVDYPSKGITAITWVHGDEIVFIPKSSLWDAEVFTSKEAKLQFALTHSIHKRLNRLGKV